MHVDSLFMGHKNERGETVICLVSREAITKMTMAIAIPNKSTNAGTKNDDILRGNWLLASGCHRQV